jgi:hypothetical protein
VLFKLFFAKEYPTNKTLNTGNKNKILMKNDKSYFLEKNCTCYKKLSKFEQYFELVSRIVKLKILTRKTTDKNTTWK